MTAAPNTEIQPKTVAAHRFSVAPMMDWTDRHCRFFHRQLTRRALLYTEMVTAEAVLQAIASGCSASIRREHPVALQLGGSEPAEARRGGARSARSSAMTRSISMSAARRTGCSPARFGACLMAEPELVADCVAAMRRRRAGPGDGEMPHRRRRAGSGAGARRASSTGASRPGCDALRRACAQGLARRAVARRRTARSRRSTMAASIG